MRFGLVPLERIWRVFGGCFQEKSGLVLDKLTVEGVQYMNKQLLRDYFRGEDMG